MQKVLSDIETKKINAKNTLISYRGCFYDWIGDTNTYNEVNAYLSSSDATVNEGLSYYFSKYGEIPWADRDNCAAFSNIIYKLLTTVRYYVRFGKLDYTDKKNCKNNNEMVFVIYNVV